MGIQHHNQRYQNNMVHAKFCFLLAFGILGLVVKADPIRNWSIETNSIDETDEAREIDALPEGLMMEDEEGQLVEISLKVPADDNEEVRAKFYLFTKQNPTTHHELRYKDPHSLASSHFNHNKETYFVTHGWINSATSPVCNLIRDAYLKHHDVNIIVVDWSKVTMRPYVWASRRVLPIAKQTAKMIDFMVAHGKLNTKRTTLIGHSLGAHVMGLAGFHAKATIETIVGLDPALPMFRYAGPGSRISSKDANNVQIIHTNAGLLGYREAIGHVDFYPNGGSKQPGCSPDPSGSCSHARSYHFYAESINSHIGFHGKSCDSYQNYKNGHCKDKHSALMAGPKITVASPGNYFLSTNNKSPYAMKV